MRFSSPYLWPTALPSELHFAQGYSTILPGYKRPRPQHRNPAMSFFSDNQQRRCHSKPQPAVCLGARNERSQKALHRLNACAFQCSRHAGSTRDLGGNSPSVLFGTKYPRVQTLDISLRGKGRFDWHLHRSVGENTSSRSSHSRSRQHRCHVQRADRPGWILTPAILRYRPSKGCKEIRVRKSHTQRKL